MGSYISCQNHKKKITIKQDNIFEFLIPELQDVILQYLSYIDIVFSELDTYISEIGWKMMTINNFQDIMCDLNSKGMLSTWKRYFYYMYHMKFGEAVYKNIEIDKDLIFNFSTLYHYIINAKEITDLQNSYIQKLYPNEISILSNSIYKLDVGDILSINSFYYFCIGKNNNQKTLMSYNIIEFGITSPPLNFKIIEEYSPLYWIRTGYLGHNLEINSFVLNISSLTDTYETLYISEIDFIEIISFVYQNIKYAIIRYGLSSDRLLASNLCLMPISLEYKSLDSIPHYNILKSHKIHPDHIFLNNFFKTI